MLKCEIISLVKSEIVKVGAILFFYFLYILNLFDQLILACVTGYRYISRLYCLVVQVGFHRDVVVFASDAEGRGFDPGQDRRYFSSPVTFGTPT